MRYLKLEEQKYIENKGDVLACKAYHLMFPEGRESICNDGIKEIDNKQWEIFWVSKETEKAYYGTPAEGLGLMNCMILKEDTREFLPEEIETLEKQYYSLGSMMTGEIRQTQKIKIEPIKSKWEGKEGAINETT